MAVQLSDEQMRVVNSRGRAIAVIASAGSGKTEVVAHRVRRLLTEPASESFRILALSYTVKAADELNERLRDQVGDVRRVDAETIHAFSHNLVRQHGTWEGLPAEPEVLYRDEDRIELLVSWLADSGERLDPADAGAVLREIDLARARLSSARFLDEYREALASRGALDYPAMLEVSARLLERDWVRTQISQLYKHLVVDEAQNLTPAQYQLLSAVLGPAPSPVSALFVGDEKQSIVQFAGADPELIKRFEFDYGAERIELSQNFRSATAISKIADEISAELGDPAQLSVASAAPGEVRISEALNEAAEGRAAAEWAKELLDSGLPAEALAPGESTHIIPEDIAVLARSAAALRCTAEALEVAGLEFVVASDAHEWMSSPLGRAIVDLVAYRAGPDHRSARDHLQSSAGATIDNLERSPVEGFADVVKNSDEDDPASLLASTRLLRINRTDDPSWAGDLALLEETWQRFVDRTPQLDRTFGSFQLHIARTQRGEPAASGIRLLTIHKSQGQEFRAVTIVGMNQGQFPDFRQTGDAERRAELHCFYVAVTRASRVLRLSRACERQGRNGPWVSGESEYLSIVRRSGAQS